MRRALILAALALAACSSKPASTNAPAGTADAVTAPARSHVHDVACGCALGLACQNMISVDGKFVPLTGPATAGLGDMAFCGKKGQQAKADGKLEDGKFVASTFELLAEQAR